MYILNGHGASPLFKFEFFHKYFIVERGTIICTMSSLPFSYNLLSRSQAMKRDGNDFNAMVGGKDFM